MYPQQLFTDKLDPVPASVHWPTLIAMCQRRGVPVTRVDRCGEVHVIRTAADLADLADMDT